MLYVYSWLCSLYNAFTRYSCSFLPFVTAFVCAKQLRRIVVGIIKHNTVGFPIIANQTHVSFTAKDLNRVQRCSSCLMTVSVKKIETTHYMTDHIFIMLQQ